jgi:putative ABC transport system ATP-binding protein
MTEIACPKVSRPADTNDTVITVVADDDCTALVTKAPIILADEPTANLDSKNGDQILELMKKLNEELKTTFVFSTHDPKIVALSNHVIKIRDGKIQEA